MHSHTEQNTIDHKTQLKIERLEYLLNFSENLVLIEDINSLLDQLLYDARSECMAEAGSIYLLEDGALRFSYVQNDLLARTKYDNRQYLYADHTVAIDEKSIAGYTASTGETLNIKDVYNIPATESYCLNPIFDQETGYRTRSIISAPLRKEGGELIGVIQLINPSDKLSFSEDDKNYIYHIGRIASSAIQRAQAGNATFMRMLKMAELRDPKETGAHVNRVGAYSIEIYDAWAKNRGIEEQEIRAFKEPLHIAAMLHDIGKVAISDLILKKPAKLTDEEFDIMRGHTSSGASLFNDSDIKLDRMSYETTLYHHECWNGTGYPHQLKGEEIPLHARIVAVADVYDALISVRAYKDSWSEDKVLSYMQEQSGKHFDPELIDIFISIQEIIRGIRHRYRET